MRILKKNPVLYFFYFTLALTYFLSACISGNGNVPDTSGIEVNLESRRFDLDLYALDTANISEGLGELKRKYPDFADFFLDTLMAYGIHGNYSDTVTGIREGLIPFLTFKDYKELEDYIKKQYPDTKQVDEELTKGFKLLKYYFPGTRVPRIIYLNMGLSRWSAFPVDSNTQCIGLDMFLGDDYPHYTAVGEPVYMNTHRRESYIPVSVFSSLYRLAAPMKTQEKTLLDLMLQHGKEMYFLHKILPSLPDSVLFGFTGKQIEWCNQNEYYIYNFFIKNSLIYSKESQNIMPYVTDGPFARGMEPATSTEKMTPGNIGTWLGYKMITAYMTQHSEVTLQQLVALQPDPQTFLTEGKYKPR